MIFHRFNHHQIHGESAQSADLFLTVAPYFRRRGRRGPRRHRSRDAKRSWMARTGCMHHMYLDVSLGMLHQYIYLSIYLFIYIYIYCDVYM